MTTMTVEEFMAQHPRIIPTCTKYTVLDEHGHITECWELVNGMFVDTTELRTAEQTLAKYQKQADKLKADKKDTK